MLATSFRASLNWCGSWHAADLEELAARVRAAELAFFTAGDAVRPYAEAHAAAQEQAAQALAMWQLAAPAAEILRGTAVGVLPPNAPADPEADLVRAGAMAREAREILTAAGRALAETMDVPPKQPSLPGLAARVLLAFTDENSMAGIVPPGSPIQLLYATEVMEFALSRNAGVLLYYRPHESTALIPARNREVRRLLGRV